MYGWMKSNVGADHCVGPRRIEDELKNPLRCGPTQGSALTVIHEKFTPQSFPSAQSTHRFQARGSYLRRHYKLTAKSKTSKTKSIKN